MVNNASWWHNTTTANRLEQLRSGLELGMTMGQIAICSGTHRPAIQSFAQNKGINVPYENKAQNARRAAIKHIEENGPLNINVLPVDSFIKQERFE